jgi:hypothetical protein
VTYVVLSHDDSKKVTIRSLSDSIKKATPHARVVICEPFRLNWSCSIKYDQGIVDEYDVRVDSDRNRSIGNADDGIDVTDP